MCVANLEFQLVNPTTQVALFSICPDNCTSIQSITWNVYQGFKNGSSTILQWIHFNQMITYQNIWFFGNNFILFELFIMNYFRYKYK
jgi:hypothetical protein